MPDDESHQTIASKTIVGLYLLLFRALLKDYIIAFNELVETENLSVHEVLINLRDQFINDRFYGTNLKELAQNTREVREMNISAVKKDITTSLTCIDKKIPNKPFLMIIDEASLLAEIPKTGRRDKFRLLRRALNLLDPSTKLVILTLGTNPDVRDLNRESNSDSFREFQAGHLFRPFVLSQNWDLFLEPDKLPINFINYESLKRGLMLLFLFSLGRPLWSSVFMARIILMAETKLSNNCLKTGESFIALWIIRTGISINPVNSLNNHLVKSLMGTVLHVSDDVSKIIVYYPSEPVLAIAACNLISTKQQELYMFLYQFIQMQAVDAGRFAEIISMDITLQGLFQADIPAGIDWNSTENLPDICKRTSFFLENSEEKEATASDAEMKSNSIKFRDTISEHYKITTVGAYLTKMFGPYSHILNYKRRNYKC